MTSHPNQIRQNEDLLIKLVVNFSEVKTSKNSFFFCFVLRIVFVDFDIISIFNGRGNEKRENRKEWSVVLKKQ